MMGDQDGMMSNVAREYANNITGDNSYGRISKNSDSFRSTRTVKLDGSHNGSYSNYVTTSSYSLASNQSQVGGTINRGTDRSQIGPSQNSLPGTPVQTVQRSTLATAPSLNRANMWCILALILPLFSMNSACSIWRCTPSTLLNTAEMLLNHLGRVLCRAHASFRHLAEDQFARDIFATAMDVVLVFYAMGFLVISMYQAALFG